MTLIVIVIPPKPASNAISTNAKCGFDNAILKVNLCGSRSKNLAA
jgi:hypothetical protein